MSTPDKSLQLVPPDERAMQPAKDPVSEIGSMLQMAVRNGVTAENATALEKLTELYERVQDRGAKKDFVTALMEFQAEAKQIKATKPVPNNDGTVRYRFAPFEDIMEQVQPMAVRHGFVISFSSEIGDGRITKICRLTHRSGHCSENTYTVRIGKGPPGSSETQADGAAHQYAKRGALVDALNIVIDKGMDDDARDLGAKITKEQADSLRARVKATGSDEKMFLKYAQAASFDEIHVNMYAALDSNLTRKERTA